MPTAVHPASLPPIETVTYPNDGPPVLATAARALCARLDLPAPRPQAKLGSPALHIDIAGGTWDLGPDAPPADGPWTWAHLSPDGTGEVVASHPALLYAWIHQLADGLADAEQEILANGVLREASFSWNRPLYDQVLTQTARTVRDFDAESYVEQLARSGFTHVEVNALAAPTPHEPGVPGEFYVPFYTYCAGLNHFVESTLTHGLYPAAYLNANLRRLQELAALGRRYGLQPGMVCFEPRSLPEQFFQRYPTLRGARIDHPFRSRHPRYTLAQDHPVARDHYRQLVQNLMKAVPDLAYLSVWTNDSGAGFEHTSSLYVGRNGGPYLIREWRTHEEIARVAGNSALRWLRLVQETAAETNPDFEVSLRIEPFKVEHDTIMAGMGDGLTIEAPSLLVRGYDLPYAHLQYPDQESAGGTLFHVEMEESERELLERHRAQGFEPKITYSAASSFNVEPLLGIPFPRLLHRKLMALRETGFRAISAHGGLLHLQKTPYWPHPDVIRAVQLTPERSIDDVLHATAARFSGPDHAATLVELWDALEDAISYMPIVPLYSHFGFVWLRTWVRPLVPDIEAIPAGERRYYERFMVSTANNPNINDLGKDVLFELMDQTSARIMAERFDENVRRRLTSALKRLDELVQTAPDESRAVFVDLRERTRALSCWATTQRNTCAWVAGVYGYLEAETASDQQACRSYLKEMTDLDLENTRALLDLWQQSDTEFMLVSGTGETAFVYGDNLGELLRRKIALTERYADTEPQIDESIIWRLD